MKYKNFKTTRTTETVGSEYLIYILKNWNSFCKGHRKATEAIKAVVTENEALKRENALLKAQLREIRNIIGKA